MRSTMMDTPLLVTQLLRHGAQIHGDRRVVTWHGDHASHVRFADTAERAERLAAALTALGVGRGDGDAAPLGERIDRCVGLRRAGRDRPVQPAAPGDRRRGGAARDDRRVKAALWRDDLPGLGDDRVQSAGRHLDPAAGDARRRRAPWDGKSMGELEVRGPWVTGGYHGVDAADKFDDGWLRTGDVVVVEPNGFFQIVDRAKDLIKSGGEWISSVDLENALMAHDDVAEAAVIGVVDPTWDERPLACVVRKEGADVSPEDLQAFLRERVATWWVPERWALIDEVPKTSVGKFDKKVLRDRHTRGDLPVELRER